MAKINFRSFQKEFLEKIYDEDGNVKRNKDGEIVLAKVIRIVRHNAAYFPKKK